MKSVSISGSPRENVGKKDAKELRRKEQVPCVLYGGKEQIHFSAEEKAFKDLIYTPEVHTVELAIGGTTYNAILQEIQYHPLRESILHVDFLELSPKKPVKINVPVKLIGVAAGVKEGGRLDKKLRLLKVTALPADLPDTIEVNVEHLNVGDTVKVKEITSKKWTILDAPHAVIATVKGKRVEAVEATPAAGAPAAAPAGAAAKAPAAAAPAAEKKPANKK